MWARRKPGVRAVRVRVRVRVTVRVRVRVIEASVPCVESPPPPISILSVWMFAPKCGRNR